MIKEINPTSKENHVIKLGSLVEIVYDNEQKGVRMFVVKHSRDCDGEPLYDLSFEPEAQKELDEFNSTPKDHETPQTLYMWNKGMVESKFYRHCSKEMLKVIREPS